MFLGSKQFRAILPWNFCSEKDAQTHRDTFINEYVNKYVCVYICMQVYKQFKRKSNMIVIGTV